MEKLLPLSNVKKKRSKQIVWYRSNGLRIANYCFMNLDFDATLKNENKELNGSPENELNKENGLVFES